MLQERSRAEGRAEARSEETGRFVRQVRRVARRKFIPEEKVGTVLEGFRGKVRLSELCRREGIRREPGGPGGIRTHDSRIKSPELVRSDFEALTRFGEVTLRGRSNAQSPRRHPTLADEGILS